MSENIIEILTLSEVLAVTKLSKTQVYRLAKRGQFPRQIHLTAGRVVWKKSDVASWLSSRVEG